MTGALNVSRSTCKGSLLCEGVREFGGGRQRSRNVWNGIVGQIIFFSDLFLAVQPVTVEDQQIVAEYVFIFAVMFV